MFPRTIHVIATIVTTGIVTNPLAVTMHVRGLWMALEIAEVALVALIPLPLIAGPLSARALIRLTLVLSTLFWRALLNGGLPLFGSALLRGRLNWSRSTRRDISATDTTLVSAPAIPAIIPAPLPAVPLLRKARNCGTQREQGKKY
jgi:hypothetical protein